MTEENKNTESPKSENNPQQNPNRGDKKLPPMPPKPPATKFGRSLAGWVLILAIVLTMMAFMRGALNEGREISIIDFWTYVDNGQVTGEIVVRHDKITGKNVDVMLKEGQPKNFYVVYPHAEDEKFTDKLKEASAKYPGKFTVKFKRIGWFEAMFPHLIVTGLILVMIWFLLFRRMGGAGGGPGFFGNFGRSKHRVMNREQSKVTLKDVAGIDEAKEEVGEMITFLKDPKKFQRLGGRVPRGVLLVGQPGCGKTMLAKAIAGEADVPFFSISGSDFVEMFVGVGASRVRDLFKQAKDSSPCIIFLDEIDAVGRRRSGGMGMGGGHDEREQTLNAILVEMDGFDSNDQVIVIAATNRLDVLDPALTRPGRFDRQITVPLPDLEGRYQILKIYADKVKCADDVDLKRIARGTPMFSGADLAALVNEAAIMATMGNKEAVETVDMEEARDKVRWGRARKSHKYDEEERRVTAYHEAGHALIQVLSPHSDPLHKVSIIPRGPMGGATFSLPEKDRHLYTKNFCLDMLKVCFGGRVAEEIFCNDISSGASGDIQQATSIARQMVTDWGMSEKLGFIAYSNEPKLTFTGAVSNHDYSEETASKIDSEVKEFIELAHRETRDMMLANREKTENIAQALLKYETLSADDVDAIMEGKTIDKPTVAALLEVEQQKDQDNGESVEKTNE